MDNFLEKSKLNFWTKNEDFEQCVPYISAGWHVCSDQKFFNGRSQAQNVRIPIHHTFWHMYFHKRRFSIKGIHFTLPFQMESGQFQISFKYFPGFSSIKEIQITQSVAFEVLNFGIFHQFLSY